MCELKPEDEGGLCACARRRLVQARVLAELDRIVAEHAVARKVGLSVAERKKENPDVRTQT
jgi:hypothetical protein